MPIQEWTLTYDQKGQPFLTHEKSNQHWHATLTHTRGLVAAGISRSPIGVDAESMWMHWETVDELSYRYFTKREYKEIQLLPLADRNTRFLEIWTLKEAYLKACGTGLCGGLTSTCFSDVRHGYFEAKEMRPSSINPSPRISHYRINDYHLSVCSLSGSHVDVYRMTFGDGRWLATLPRLLAHRTTALGRWSTDFGQPTFEPAYSTQTKEKIG
jgi:phosphopantetheinyl transferase